MTEAKESNKLRMEIIKLKERVNELQALNSSSVLMAWFHLMWKIWGSTLILIDSYFIN